MKELVARFLACTALAIVSLHQLKRAIATSVLQYRLEFQYEYSIRVFYIIELHRRCNWINNQTAVIYQ